jgi:hypothetical protein
MKTKRNNTVINNTCWNNSIIDKNMMFVDGCIFIAKTNNDYRFGEEAKDVGW